MKFSSEHKDLIIKYILTKIGEKKSGISHSVAQSFCISTSTVHCYINELIEQGVIIKTGRDNYILTSEKFVFDFSRSAGELISEDSIYNNCLAPIIKDFPSNVKSIWQYAFSEMVNNTIDHSEGEHLQIIIRKDRLSVNVLIIDDGVGAFSKIKKHFGYQSVEDAIIELSKGKLTTDSIHHSGEGIFFTSRIMDEFLLCSDCKKYSFNKYSEEVFSDMEKEQLSGTAVYLSLANNSQKQIADIFNEYSDVDDGFTRTRIPMKNIFETAPISRSQAKRIGSRLEQFKEIEIDFDGIEFMGQGFAHELFFVFANAHPELKLTPLNMNEQVKKMYHHVNGN